MASTVTDEHRQQAAEVLGLSGHTRLSYESMSRIEAVAQLMEELTDLRAMKVRLEAKRDSLAMDPGVNHREVRALDEILGVW